MKNKKLTAILLAVAVSASVLSGCGTDKIDKNAVVATMGDTGISMGVYNFLFHYGEASMDDLYSGYFGQDYWTSDLYGKGNTFWEDTKSELLENVHAYYTLSDEARMAELGVSLTEEETAAMKEAAKAFMAANTQEALDEMGATEEIVTEALRLITITNKMQAAIRAQVDTTVAEDEYVQRGYSVVHSSLERRYNSSTGSYEDISETDMLQIIVYFSNMSALISEGKTLEEAAEECGYSVSSDSYNAKNNDLDEDVLTALEALAVGETSGIVQTDTDIYIFRVNSDNDAEASESAKADIISDRQSEAYTEQLAAWQENDGWTVNDKVLATLQFDNYLTQKAETEGSEAVETTESK